MNYQYNNDIRRRVEDCRGRLRRVHRTTTQQTVEQNTSVEVNEPRDLSATAIDAELHRHGVRHLKKGTISEIEATVR